MSTQHNSYSNPVGSITLHHGSMSIRRNYMLTSHRKDEFIEWMKEMLNHSFALDAKDTYTGTMLFIEDLVKEHLENPTGSRLRQVVPTISKFHTKLPLQTSFRIYDNKYSISQRHCISPSFNEIRHILNLAQVMEIGPNLKFISFDGDQTLYSDGGNFDASNDELALAIIRLLCHNVKVAVITAAGYGLDGSKYEHRLQGLLQRFIDGKWLFFS
jgi:IMP and pyridine-specific 5'-nucleotidase